MNTSIQTSSVRKFSVELSLTPHSFQTKICSRLLLLRILVAVSCNHSGNVAIGVTSSKNQLCGLVQGKYDCFSRGRGRCSGAVQYEWRTVASHPLERYRWHLDGILSSEQFVDEDVKLSTEVKRSCNLFSNINTSYVQ